MSGKVIQLFPGVGRNDPCPCGSGKKYKKCCQAIHEEEERIQHRLEEVYTVSDKYFTVKEYITEAGYPITNFDFFVLELLNVIGDILDKYRKTSWDSSKSILRYILGETKNFYNSCKSCDVACLEKPMEKASLQSLMDKGWRLQEFPEQLQKPLFVNLFYFEFLNVVGKALDDGVKRILNESDVEEIGSTVHDSIFTYVAENCWENCDIECLRKSKKNAYCKFCSFSGGKLSCPKKGEITYSEIMASEEDMTH